MSTNLYREELLDHYKNPRNKKEVANPDFSSGHNNPACGDSIEITGRLQDGKITEIGFSGVGCIISQAAASMLTEKCIGMTIEEVLALTKDDVLEMMGLKLGPNRLKCALLALEALKDALMAYQQKQQK